jgi:hypothetical protein
LYSKSDANGQAGEKKWQKGKKGHFCVKIARFRAIFQQDQPLRRVSIGGQCRKSLQRFATLLHI